MSWRSAPTRESYTTTIPTYSNSVSPPQTLSFSLYISSENPHHQTCSIYKQPNYIFKQKKITFFTTEMKKKKSICFWLMGEFCKKRKEVTWVGHKRQVAKSTWGTAYQACHIWGNQTQHQWKGKMMNRRVGMKGLSPISLETNCTHSLAFSLSSWSHYTSAAQLLLLLATLMTKAQIGITKRAKRGNQNPFWILG